MPRTPQSISLLAHDRSSTITTTDDPSYLFSRMQLRRTIGRPPELEMTFVHPGHPDVEGYDHRRVLQFDYDNGDEELWRIEEAVRDYSRGSDATLKRGSSGVLDRR